MQKIGKSIAKGAARFLVVAAALIALSILLDGMYLLGLPAQGQVRSVSVFCPEAAAQAKEVSSPQEIELALQVTGLLKYDLFAQASEEQPPAVAITYHLRDGSDVSIGIQRGHDAAGGAHRHAGCVLGLGRRQPALALRPCQPTRGRAQRSFGVFGRQAAPMARKTTQPA